MSFDLFFWEASAPCDAKAARKRYGAFCDQDSDGAPPASSKLEAFRDALLEIYPLPEDAEESPWSEGPRASAEGLSICLAWSATKRVVPRIFKLASRHGILCYDPQEDRVLLPAGMKAPAGKRAPSSREAFAAVCAELLEPHGFKLGGDFGTHFDRRRRNRTESIGFSSIPVEGGIRIRMALAILSQPLRKWRESGGRLEPEPSEGGPAGLASVDFRKLAPDHRLFDLEVEDTESRKSAPGDALDLITTHGFAYADLFEDAGRLAGRLAEKDVPGLPYPAALEFLLFQDRKDLAKAMVQALLGRHPEWASFYGSKVLPESLPREGRRLLAAAALYDL